MDNKYDKQPKSGQELIEVLKNRDLSIEDEARALRYLESIGYYRLSGYMFHLQVPGKMHQFTEGTSFNDIINTYKFDKRLRAIVMEYMERIEVALRAKMTDVYSSAHGFFWYASESLFTNKVVAASILAGIKSDFAIPKETFLKSYKKNYRAELLPPSQMVLETLSLGTLVTLYEALSGTQHKVDIALWFGLPVNVLESWLVWLVNVRNICAHHGRLWNKIVSAKRPLIPEKKSFKFYVSLHEDFHTKMYGAVALINRLLKSFNPDNSFTDKVEALIQEYGIDASLMGFPADWKENAVWHHESEHLRRPLSREEELRFARRG